MSVALAAENLGFRYEGRGPLVLEGVRLRVQKGTCLALLGASGSGKSTLLLHLNGTLKPEAGQVYLNGVPVSYRWRALKEWRHRVGLVLQDPDDQVACPLVYQDVAFGPQNLGLATEEVQRRVATSLEWVGIGHLSDRGVHQLSFGEKKRVALAGVLAMGPEVLLLDEPTAGLDPRATRQLMETLAARKAGGSALVMATHDVDLAFAWADEVVVLSRGRALCQGESKTILADAALLEGAGLRLPWLAELAAEARRRGWLEEGRALPGTLATLMAQLGECLGCEDRRHEVHSHENRERR
ncbi:MAG: ABC transporter ATP-binding protein [Candidatus Handelsmanbacteria bacterium]|nr:ABC transporter ATP-binding protein [Candidatus Handelsmanbacteria bacterium]